MPPARPLAEEHGMTEASPGGRLAGSRGDAGGNCPRSRSRVVMDTRPGKRLVER